MRPNPLGRIWEWDASYWEGSGNETKPIGESLEEKPTVAQWGRSGKRPDPLGNVWTWLGVSGNENKPTGVASFPGLHTQLLSLVVRKAGRRPGQTYPMMRAAADVTFSLLTSGFVLSPSLFFPWIQFVLSVQFVLWVWLLLDQLWLATVCDISNGTHHMINLSRPFPPTPPPPAFRTASDKSWAWRPGTEATLGRVQEWDQTNWGVSRNETGPTLWSKHQYWYFHWWVLHGPPICSKHPCNMHYCVYMFLIMWCF